MEMVVGIGTGTELLRLEHARMHPHIEDLRTTGNMVGNAPIGDLRRAVDTSCGFLSQHLLPHAAAEERVVYPVIERRLKSSFSTATMSRDHGEIEELGRELEHLRDQLLEMELTQTLASSLRRVLYGLYEAIRLHFAKEEEIYFPVLDQALTPEEARHLFEAMEQVALEPVGR